MILQIWTVSDEWATAWDGWKTGLFTDLDVEEMEAAAGTFTKKVCVHPDRVQSVCKALAKR